ncbi:MAG: AbrB/MazE/SpoVT family DNA-binding domain-containing protein [Candidatus Bipolaricaulota bacterium]
MSAQEDMAMVMSKTTSKGQTTTPKEIRDRFGLKAKIGRHSSGEGIRQSRVAEKG